MPGFDGTGPLGYGPMTGGGRGYCMVPAGRGRGMGWGRGLAWRRGAPGFARGRFARPRRAGTAAESEADFLRREAEALKGEQTE